MRDRRRRLVGSLSILFVVVMVVAGKSMLGLFGPEYQAAYPALCLISIGTGLATTFAMAPEYLKFAGHRQTILWITGITAAGLLGLTAWWAPRYGATGAATAFAICISLMSLLFLAAAERHFSNSLAQAELSAPESPEMHPHDD